jgi:predicted dehydrogenase
MKIGVLGAGHLGKIHLRLLKELEEFELVGFFDPNPEAAKIVSEEYGIQSFSSKQELISAVDVVDIVTPTLSHYECSIEALKAGKHIFIEKPVTNSLEEAYELSKLRKEMGTRVQIGHVERFNPAYIAAEGAYDKPMFIETHRLAQFNPRGTDVSVVLDLMIHDIDIVLNIVKSKVKSVKANGVAVASETPDICNARLEFENGCVANLTASRISMKNMRKTRLFQKDAYISIDFLEKECEVVRMRDIDPENANPYSMVIDVDTNGNKKEIHFEKLEVIENNAIKEELKSFYQAIIQEETPIVSLTDGTKALELAYQIADSIK